MKFALRCVSWGTFVALIALPTLATAASEDKNPTPKKRSHAAESSTAPKTIGAGGLPTSELPPPRSSDTPPPPAPEPELHGIKITKEAGIGGTQAYARSGVLELGGSVGFARAASFTQFNISPSVGWFFTNNFELSGIVGVNYIDTNSSNSTIVNLLAEPSFHLPFSEYLYGFVGVGAGVAYAKGPGTGFALAPRLGLNILVGRSGILTPALAMVYSTAETVSANGVTGDHTSVGANIGYTVMW